MVSTKGPLSKVHLDSLYILNTMENLELTLWKGSYSSRRVHLAHWEEDVLNITDPSACRVTVIFPKS